MGTGRVRVGRQLSTGVAFGLSASVQSFQGNDTLYFPEYDTPATNFGVAQGLDYTRHKNLLGHVSVRGLTAGAGYNKRVRGMPTGAYGTVFNDGRTSTPAPLSPLPYRERDWVAGSTAAGSRP